jgi:hypothetical protein
MSMGYDKSKFRLSETFNNNDGKTSGSGFIGVLMGLCAIISFLTVLVGWWLHQADILEMFDKVLQLGLLSAALMGVRKISGVLTDGRGKTTKVEGESEAGDQKV